MIAIFNRSLKQREMADQSAKTLRQQHLSSLGVQCPLWIFSADDPRWPRRLDSLLPNSHPAKITRWAASFSEYAMHLSQLQPLPGEGSKPITRSQDAELALKALTQLRYDDTYDRDSLQVIFSDHGQERAKPLSEWIFPSNNNSPNNNRNTIDPALILRIERKWDNVPLWNPTQNLTRLSDFSPEDSIFGVATLVADDDELLSASGIQKSDGGEEIRRAEFQCLDDEDVGGFVQGVVCPSRWAEPGAQGLVLRRGPKDKGNRRVLAGTILQNALWEEVVEGRG